MFTCGLDPSCVTQVSAYYVFLNIIRYYPIAGALFVFLYLWKKRSLINYKIQEKFPQFDKVKKEMAQSFVTLLMFSCIGTCVYVLNVLGVIRTQIYWDPTLHGGVPYMVLSFLLITIWHETWFYWAHRIMHHPSIYKYVHAVHHRSVNPTPVAAYNFHWLEAIIEGIYVVPFLILVPMYYPVFLAHTFYAMILNIYFHSGYEFYPKGFTRGRVFKWINTSTHHNMHHSKFTGNYSLYFNFWDRIMGTNFKNYEDTFDGVINKRLRTRHPPTEEPMSLSKGSSSV
jgi:lathosterol oxidase